MKKILFTIIVFSTLFSNYIGSWLVIGSIPSGAIVRDGSIFLFICLAIMNKSFFKFNKKELKIFSIYLLLLFSVSISFLNANSFLQGIMGSRVYILYTLLLLVLIKSKFITINNDFVIMNILIAFLVADLIALIDFFSLGQFSYFLGYIPGNLYNNLVLITSFEDKIRLNGGFADALNFGYFLALSVALTLNLIIQKVNHRLLTLSVLVLSTISVLFTLTRGAIFVTFLLYIFFIIYKFYKKPSRILLLSIFSFLMAIFIFFIFNYELLETLASRFTNSDASSKGSTSGRFLMAENSINYLLENPQGMGLGTQGTAYLISDIDNRLNTDNYFFWTALEIGLSGLILHTTLYFLIFKYYIENIYKLEFIKLSLFTIFIVSALISSSFISALVLIFYMIILLLPRRLNENCNRL